MSSQNSSTADGKPTSSTYAQQSQSSGNLYSFSVHQPYTNWPLHSSHTTPYAPSWYSHPTQQYAAAVAHKAYREQATQTVQPDESPASELNGKGKERDSGESGLKFAKQWDTALSTFFKRVGLHQTMAGFHEDMMLLNENWEREQVPSALQALIKDVAESENSTLPKRSLEERQLAHVSSQVGIEVQTPSATVKSVSRLLKQSRRRNDASNRAEFLLSVAEKRRRLNELGESSSPLLTGSEGPLQGQQETGNTEVDAPTASCARVDAKYQDREIQMKYDIAKNEDGPLKRTMKRKQAEDDASVQSVRTQLPVVRDEAREPDAKSHPGLTARMENIEDHLGIRFVPSRPRSFLDRLKFLEDYIIRLEKDYPPWAALHFNQPNRGWPPPPRSTPIIVPPHLATPKSSSYPSTPAEFAAIAQGRRVGSSAIIPATGQTSSVKSGNSSKAKSAQSSLHRAVMERLEIKRAIGDLTGDVAPLSSSSQST